MRRYHTLYQAETCKTSLKKTSWLGRGMCPDRRFLKYLSKILRNKIEDISTIDE